MNLNLKTIVKHVSNAVSAASGARAVADRVSTVSGCTALGNEYRRRYEQLQAMPEFCGMKTPEVSKQLGHLGRQQEELKRVSLRREIEENSPRIDRENKRELDAADLRIKGLEAIQESTQKALTAAETRTAEMQTRIDGLNRELSDARAAAADVVEKAKAAFRAVFEQEQDAAKEKAAAQALRQAQADQAVAGSDIELRIDGMSHQLQRLQDLESAERGKLQEAMQQLALATLRRHEIRLDIATKAMVDATVTGRCEIELLERFLPDHEVDQLRRRKMNATDFQVFGPHRFPAAAGLIRDNMLFGVERMVEAFAKEPDLGLLFGESGGATQTDTEVLSGHSPEPAVV